MAPPEIMWPWEHLAVGYLTYSLAIRLFRDRSPTGVESYAVLFGSQFPDLIDKPASWIFHLLPTGVSLAHSVLVAVPLAIVLAAASWRIGRAGVGVAFGTGYLLHLPADYLYGALVGGSLPPYRTFLWPIAKTTSDPPGGFITNVSYYFAKYQAALGNPRTLWFLAFEIGLLSVALLLWIADGTPGWVSFRRRIGGRGR